MSYLCENTTCRWYDKSLDDRCSGGDEHGNPLAELCKEKAKPAAVQSAEDDTPRQFAERLPWMSVNGKPDFAQWENRIAYRDAAQRQAGREERMDEEPAEIDDLKNKLETLGYDIAMMKQRYAAVVEAAREAHKLLMLPNQYEDCDNGQRFNLDVDGDAWGIPREALRKALAALDEGR